MLLFNGVIDWVLVTDNEVQLFTKKKRKVLNTIIHTSSVSSHLATLRTLSSAPHLSGPNIIVYVLSELTDLMSRSGEAVSNLIYAPPQSSPCCN